MQPVPAGTCTLPLVATGAATSADRGNDHRYPVATAPAPMGTHSGGTARGNSRAARHLRRFAGTFDRDDSYLLAGLRFMFRALPRYD